MTRPHPRFLTGTNSTEAESPESAAVNVESDFVVILAVLLCALICVVGLIAVVRCAWLRRSSSVGRESSAAANKGVKKKVLESFPKFTYNNNNCGGEAKQVEECAICLAEFVNGDEIRELPECGHGFHLRCVDKWLASHSSCPSCRHVLGVARCQKCGQFPAIGGAVILEMEPKARREDDGNGFLP